MTETITKKDVEKKDKEDLAWTLILWNDQVNTFDYVIECLVKICDHSVEQATQCSYIIHHSGKCDVKKGSFDELYVMKQKLNECHLEATLEQ